MPSVIFPMADYGHDPTEVAVPYRVFKDAGFDIDFVTEKGAVPKCDSKMLEGITGATLGADAAAKKAYADMEATSPGLQSPKSWTDPSFTFDNFDMVFLPGGHEKGVRQVIDSPIVHKLLAGYFPKTTRGGSADNNKVVGAICHGVQVLAFTPDPSADLQQYPVNIKGEIVQADAQKYKSIIHSCKTTALPGFLESGAYQGTRLFLGDYYKTYGAGTPNVEDFVKVGLDDPDQFVTGPGILSGATNPMFVEDEQYRYVSGRFPPDAEVTAKRCVELVKEIHSSH